MAPSPMWPYNLSDKPGLTFATSFRYWKQQQNTGLEFSMSGDFNIPYLPTLLLGYKSLDYADRQFGLKQVRGLLT